MSLIEEFPKFLFKHRKSILLCSSLILVSLFSFFSYRFLSYREEQEANKRFYMIQSVFKKALKKEREKRNKNEKKTDFLNMNLNRVIFNQEDLDQHFSENIKEYKSFIEKNKNRNAAFLAALELGELYFDAKNFQALKDVFSPLIPFVRENQTLGHLFLNTLSNSLMELKEWEAALIHLKKILKNKKASYLHANVLLKMGLGYENLKQRDKAIESYTNLIKKFPNSLFTRKAQSYLNFIYLNSKLNNKLDNKI